MPGADLKHTFIPKQIVQETARQSPVRGKSANILFIAAFIIFVLTVLAAAGAYAYRAYLVRSVKSANLSLERAKAAFEPDTIRAVKRFSERVLVSDGLLAQHTAPSVFFAVLQDLTLKSARFSKFTYSFDGADVAVSLSGTAKNYSSVALQSDMLGKSPYIKNLVFSNLNLDKAGNVTFDITFSVDPTLLLYKDVALRASAAGTEQ